MQLMLIKDAFVSKNGILLLNGPLILEGVQRRSEVQKAFGENVEIIEPNGTKFVASIKDVAISQAINGEIQVCIAVELPSDKEGVAIDSVVSALK